jgi:hypothetical protein
VGWVEWLIDQVSILILRSNGGWREDEDWYRGRLPTDHQSSNSPVSWRLGGHLPFDLRLTYFLLTVEAADLSSVGSSQVIRRIRAVPPPGTE